MRWPGPQRLTVMALLAALAGGLVAGWWLTERDANIAFLPARPPAEWIVCPTPADGIAAPCAALPSEFQRPFVLASAPASATLSICAFKGAVVSVNGRVAGPPAERGATWKQPDSYDVAALLKAGTNVLSVIVTNAAGPGALWLWLNATGASVVSDATWQASCAGAAWHAARLASEPMPINPGNPMYGGAEPLASAKAHSVTLAIFAALAVAAVIAWKLWMSSASRPGAPKAPTWAELFLATTAALIVAYIVLWIHNQRLLPPYTGFDAADHLEYVSRLLTKSALPAANEGWEMYQPPLYYEITAGCLAMAGRAALDVEAVTDLRWFSLVVCIAMFVLVSQSVRLIFPSRPRPQFFGLLLAALWPVSLYLGEYITNEILAAAFVAGAIYCLLRILTSPNIRARDYVIFGLVMGCAFLTKSSAVVLLPLTFMALAWNLFSKGVSTPMVWLKCLGMALGCCFAVCGWHYAQVTMQFGNPLVGNWDTATGFVWWQYPGYRTARYFCSFGEALSHPVYRAAFTSFFDGTYSTLWGDGLCSGSPFVTYRAPWNYSLMAVGYWLSLLPSAAILLGAVVRLSAFVRKPRPEDFFLLALPALVLALLMFYALKIPSYAAAKAFYGSAALTPLCALGAAGLDFVAEKMRRLNGILYFAFVLWALNAYASFWVPNNEETQIILARDEAYRGFRQPAAYRLQTLLQHDSNNAIAMAIFSQQTAFLLGTSTALPYAQRAVDLAPDEMEPHMNLAALLLRENQADPAIEQLRRVVELGSDNAEAFNMLSAHLHDSGQDAEALSVCREGLRLNPANAELHTRLASILQRLGDTNQAQEQLRIVDEITRSTAESHLSL